MCVVHVHVHADDACSVLMCVLMLLMLVEGRDKRTFCALCLLIARVYPSQVKRRYECFKDRRVNADKSAHGATASNKN